MKITIDMDMTPEEARKLMGLPDLEPLQTAMMSKVQQQMEEYFSDIADPEAMFNKFMPLGVNAMEQYKNFYSHLANSTYNASKKEDD
ncbi:MAG: uncharacterized membrane-anchored protein YhcB (DUF1043 family) [Candidatus Endobugula sp.]|jgi:uncharacterized membrane-anchored protein YhcB (DUF1043 family)